MTTQVRQLTDAECEAFRRAPGSFNDMVRDIDTAGWNACHAHMKEALIESDLDLDRFRALADELAEALNQIKKNAESQLVCMNAMKVPDTAPEWVNANWNRTEADAALAKYHAAVKEGD